MAQGVLSRRLLARVRTLAERYVEGRAELFEERRRRGRIREGHGDLLADDIFVLGDGPRVLDCLEFDQRLRVIDVWLDAAFLAMDLERLGAIDLAEAFLAAYGDAAGERPPASLLDLFVAYRAHVRAKVALVRRAQGEPGASGEARRLLALCCRHLEAATVSLTCVGGLPGSGKTTLSRALAARLDAELLSSDEIRAALLPPGGGEPDAWERGRYSPDATSTVYDEMLRRAGVALRLGVSVVLDATWRSPRQREAARRVARACGAVMTEIETVVPDEVAATWLADRTGSASQATVETRTSMVGVFAPWPQALRLDPRCGAPEAATERVRDDVVRSAGQPRRRTTSSAASRRG
jgi:predicted kinase